LKAQDDVLDQILRDYDFELPEDLIALRPASKRDEARLLVYDQETNIISHHLIKDLPTLLPSSTTLLCNNTQVLRCRVMAQKETGAKVEIFFLDDQLDHQGLVECLLKSSSKKRIGDTFILPANAHATLVSRLENGSFLLRPSLPSTLKEYLKESGMMPIPPYIRGGQSDKQDQEDYQPLFARESGSVAAPTASLHFTPELLDQLNQRGHSRHDLTLHVGLGTFKPLELENLHNKKLHRERFKMNEETATALERSHYRVAVGTTSLRALESYQRLKPDLNQWCETDLFLMPGDEVTCVDGLMTNFHLPKSSLLMLVAAFIGLEATKRIYHEATSQKYRFFSYGDAMLLLRARRER
jgi:S-adenosylmethionine:tRNA ribosyltransferase-isomerase